MTPTQQFIIALITVLVPIIIPTVIKIIFEIKAQKIANLKALSEQYKDTIAQLCLSAESLFKNLFFFFSSSIGTLNQSQIKGIMGNLNE